MKKMGQPRILSQVALGNVAPDILITNATVFNAHTREFIPDQSVWIKDGWIAYVGPDRDPSRDRRTRVIDASGRVLIPGLIDAHTHFTACRSGIEEFVKYIIPTGTTTVVTETTELVSIAGKEGLGYLVKGFEDQPIRLHYTVPPLCGLTLFEEIHAPPNEELLPFLKDPRCLGVGEVYWSNLFLEGKQAGRVEELASMALGLGKRIEGHTAGASGRKLQAYSCFGISSCHEPITEGEVLERLRLGYWVMVREGSIRKELPGVKRIFECKIDFRRLILSTDGVHPNEMLETGYLDASLKTALRLGVPPGLAYQMVTVNVAEHFRLDSLLGSLSPGKMADMVLIPSPGEYSPQWVMVGGEMIFQEGRALAEPGKVTFPDSLYRTVRVDGFSIPAPPVRGKVRVIELVTELVTKESTVDLQDPGASKDVIWVLALERLGGGKAFTGLLKGFGLQRGAVGSTMCWDTRDLLVIGCDRASIKTVVDRLKEIGGGAVYAQGTEVISEFPAPLCGVVSVKPMEIVNEEIQKLDAALKKNGVGFEKPLLTLDTLTSPAIPHLRITHHGYVRVRDRKVLSCEI
jgi:adenine deaminase